MFNSSLKSTSPNAACRIKNLRQALTGLSLQQFVINTLEMLMYLEREEYLKELKATRYRDKSNGTYARKSLLKNASLPITPHKVYGW